MKKIKVLVNNYASNEYIDFLKKRFDVELITLENFTASKKLRGEVHLSLFTGGADVNPDIYGEQKGKYTYIDKDRDKLEKEMFHLAMYRHILNLGICRGAQFLTAMSGGRLIQHVNGHTKSHLMTMSNSYQLEVTSTHHQMMYPFELDSDKFSLIGWSTYFNSTTYLDGNNEEMKLDEKFLEPEIVFYKNTNSLAIQGHPEFAGANPEFVETALNLIEEYIK